MLSAERLKAFRVATYHLKPGLRIRSKDQAVKFIQERGFSFFWPIQGIELPSLWAAAAGNRPVPSEHHDLAGCRPLLLRPIRELRLHGRGLPGAIRGRADDGRGQASV